jgi:thiamine biosynthesis protein ThiS
MRANINYLSLKIKQHYSLKSMENIKILLNGEEKFLNHKISIKNLVEQLELDIKKIAVERNYEIILPQDFTNMTLCEGDRIEIVHFIGGG